MAAAKRADRMQDVEYVTNAETEISQPYTP